MNKDFEDVLNFDDGEEEMDFSADLISLTDEDGVEHQFELVDTMEANGNTYVALLVSAQDDPQGFLDSDGNLVIMKIIEEEGGEEILSLIEDDEEFDAISDLFMERLDDQFDFE